VPILSSLSMAQAVEQAGKEHAAKQQLPWTCNPAAAKTFWSGGVAGYRDKNRARCLGHCSVYFLCISQAF
jgi:hypothetical protein